MGQRVEQEPRKGPVRAARSRTAGDAEEAGHRDDLGGEQPPAVPIELLAGRADEERGGVEAVDRPVGHDRPGQRAAALQEYTTLSTSGRTRPVGDTVGEIEEGATPASQRAARAQGRRHPPARRRRPSSGDPHGEGHREDAPTIDRCATLRKPAASTRASISACVRRRMTQACPPRWLVRARAMKASCGCQGWPV